MPATALLAPAERARRRFCPFPLAAFCTSVAGYTFSPGKQSPGADLGRQQAGRSAEQLAVLCDTTPGCVGFTTDGVLKSAIAQPLPPWTNLGPCDGVFVKAVPAVPDCADLAGGQLYCSYCTAGGPLYCNYCTTSVVRMTCHTGGATSCKARACYSECGATSSLPLPVARHSRAVAQQPYNPAPATTGRK